MNSRAFSLPCHSKVNDLPVIFIAHSFTLLPLLHCEHKRIPSSLATTVQSKDFLCHISNNNNILSFPRQPSPYPNTFTAAQYFSCISKFLRTFDTRNHSHSPNLYGDWTITLAFKLTLKTF